ncbi:oxygenase MpaB family protein [Amnibacterium sp.]|uniref:oxygenase MpaB family protein n=1 Tax=Amnibacterium sp. TaxID=1872496 RepID=UPI003F7BB64B
MGVTGPFRAQLFDVLSGDPTGEPEWVRELGRGSGPGLFPVGSAAWEVHRDATTLVAGPRALLMQALHPGPMAGVHDWSRYREDPLGRLQGTIRWITTVTYGRADQARAASQAVQRLHERVRGTYVDRNGDRVAYAADDADLAAWVHIAFMDSFLRAHLRYGERPIPGGADAYVAQWALAGELMGVEAPPRNVRELEQRLDAFWESGVLRVDARVREAVEVIRRPPLPTLLRPAYPAIFAGSVATLPDRARRMLGLRRPGPLSDAATRAVVRASAHLLGEAPTARQGRQRNEAAT